MLCPSSTGSIASSRSSEELRSNSERTLAIIKPEAYGDAEAIMNHIKDNGFTILAKRYVRLTPEQAAELYKPHYGRTHFPLLVAHISSGPIIALVLAAYNAIHRWRTLMGPARVPEAQAYWPDSLRACYGRRTEYGDYCNGLHGSEDHPESIREIHFFFPNMIVGPVLHDWQARDYMQRNLAAVLYPILNKLTSERPPEPILWLADELLKANPNEPQFKTSNEEDERCQSSNESESDFFA